MPRFDMKLPRALPLVALAFFPVRNTDASALTAINETRSIVCLHSASSQPLTETVALDRAAVQLARRKSLHEALSGLTPTPAFAAAVRLPVADGDAAIERAAASRFCKDLSAPGLQQIGIARAGDVIWVIVSQPMADTTPDSRHRAELEVLATVNRARARGRRCGADGYPPAPPVTLSSALSEVAFEHSAQMASQDALMHDGRDGSTAAIRVHRAHIPARHVGENIASGVPTAEEVITGWLASPSHCSVIMDPRFTTMGLSYAIGPRSRSVIFWTQLFAEPP